jgi:hypothetical protein
MIIHFCGYASQPDIQIKCDQSWTIPKWGPTEGKTDKESVYETDDNRFYTFKKELVTCKDCLKCWV